MKASIFSFTRKGAMLSIQIKESLQKNGYTTACYTPEDYSAAELCSIQPDLTTMMHHIYHTCSLIVFVGACGIAVRTIAPFIQDKTTDPAVICIDEKGRYIIPLLSGHIGGANRLAQLIAQDTGGQPVITTATDLNGLLAVDQWAVKNDLHICDLTAAKKISVSLLDGKTVGLSSDFEIVGKIPEQLSLNGNHEVGICISFDEFKKPFHTTLNLIPRIAFLGLGCRQGIRREAIEELIIEVLAKNKISMKALTGIGTIDLKKQEQGLLEFSTKYALPLTFFSAGELESLDGSFTRSDFVKKIAGVDNVCERAAVLGSKNGKLLCCKTQKDGVTAALAMKVWRVNFED